MESGNSSAITSHSIKQTSDTNIGVSHRSPNTVEALLRTAVHPLDLKYRPTGGGHRAAYLANDIVISKTNEIFGYNAWSCEIKSIITEFCDQNKGGGWHIGVSAHVRVTLRDGAYHEDIGFGSADNIRQRDKAIEKAKKHAVTDGRKRCLRLFGDALGNCVRNDEYQREAMLASKTKYDQYNASVQRFQSEELLNAPVAHPVTPYTGQKESAASETAHVPSEINLDALLDPVSSGPSTNAPMPSGPNVNAPTSSSTNVSAPVSSVPASSGADVSNFTTGSNLQETKNDNHLKNTPQLGHTIETTSDVPAQLQPEDKIKKDDNALKEAIKRKREQARARLQQRTAENSIGHTNLQASKRQKPVA